MKIQTRRKRNVIRRCHNVITSQPQNPTILRNASNRAAQENENFVKIQISHLKLQSQRTRLLWPASGRYWLYNDVFKPKLHKVTFLTSSLHAGCLIHTVYKKVIGPGYNSFSFFFSSFLFLNSIPKPIRKRIFSRLWKDVRKTTTLDDLRWSLSSRNCAIRAAEKVMEQTSASQPQPVQHRKSRHHSSCTRAKKTIRLRYE